MDCLPISNRFTFPSQHFLDNTRKAERDPATLRAFQRRALQVTVPGCWLPKWCIPLGSNAVLEIWNEVVGRQVAYRPWNTKPKLFVKVKRGPLLHSKQNGWQYDPHALDTRTLQYDLYSFVFLLLSKVSSKQWRNIAFFLGEMLLMIRKEGELR